MGNQVNSLANGCMAAILAAAAIAPAKAAADAPSGLQPGLGTETWVSTDSDKTTVVKLLGRALWEFEGSTKFQGLDVERAWFAPDGQHARRQTRVYLDFADSLGAKWKWTARIGTNGDTVLGSASVRSNDWSKEFFLEREIVETPRGVDQGIYYTFGGVSADVLASDENTINLVAGLQKFTGRNDRLHLRGTFVHVLKPKLGISIQLRARYFHSTVPGEFDYYSPKDFVQLIPVLQMRRFDRSGWMYLVAGGLGVQKATASGWQTARFADIRVESPRSSRSLQAFAEVQYSNNSLVGAGSNYSYVVGRLGLTRRF
jgi:hypothetical protein